MGDTICFGFGGKTVAERMLHVSILTLWATSHNQTTCWSGDEFCVGIGDQSQADFLTSYGNEFGLNPTPCSTCC